MHLEEMTYSLSTALCQVHPHFPDWKAVNLPIAGGTSRAADGTLSIMAAGPAPSLQKADSLLKELSHPDKLFIVDGGIGQGSNLKMTHQVLAGIHILAASESMGLAARLGLDAKKVREEVLASEAWGWMFEHRTPRMLTEDYYPGASALTIILKDVVSNFFSFQTGTPQMRSKDS